ncbi:MAG: caspase family protein [Pseudomonadota bacterium]
MLWGQRVALSLICCMFASVFVGAGTITTTTAAAEQRHAFVVGIDRYSQLPDDFQLERARADAKAMAGALSQLGFRVTHESDLTRSAFSRSWDRFISRIKPGDVAAIFFAGHGVEIDNVNYLLPSDSPHIAYGRERRLRRESISVSEMLVDLRERKPSVTWLMLDACRNHPLRAPPGTRATITTTGLASMTAAKGEFIMYSAGAGQFALDRLPGRDTSPNSLFTRHLLTFVQTPGLSLNEIARQTRARVYEAAQRASQDQRPAYYDNVIGRFCPAGCGGEAKPETAAVGPTAALRQPKPSGADRGPDDEDGDRSFWTSFFRGAGPNARNGDASEDTARGANAERSAAPKAPSEPAEPRRTGRVASLDRSRPALPAAGLCLTNDILNALIGKHALPENRRAGFLLKRGTAFCSDDDDGAAPTAIVSRIANRAVAFRHRTGESFTCLARDRCQFNWPGSPVFRIAQTRDGSGVRTTYLRIVE